MNKKYVIPVETGIQDLLPKDGFYPLPSQVDTRGRGTCPLHQTHNPLVVVRDAPTVVIGARRTAVTRQLLQGNGHVRWQTAAHREEFTHRARLELL